MKILSRVLWKKEKMGCFGLIFVEFTLGNLIIDIITYSSIFLIPLIIITILDSLFL